MMTKLPLAGLSEIAQRAGVQKPVVSMWRKRYDDFPTAVAELRTGPVFLWPEVKEWLKATDRRWDANLSIDEINTASGWRVGPPRDRV